MSNSSLVSYTRISPNKNSPRNHAIDTITIHCYVGQASVESAGEWFSRSSTQASCNYMIGSDGRIGLIVDERDRSWCSSNAANDHRAVTIECASDSTHPYAINSKVYVSLINLVEDICRRNGIPELRWKGDKTLIGQIDKQNMTVHRWFKNKACPGNYIYSRLGQIAAEVNARLGSGSSTTPSKPSTGSSTNKNFPKTPFDVRVIVDDLNIRPQPNMDSNPTGVTKKGTFTIVEMSGNWGKLKSGAGWIYLANASYCSILGTVSGSPSSSSESASEKIAEDGVWGPATTRRAQEVFGTPVDGIVSNQHVDYRDGNPGLQSSSWEWKDNPSGGSALIKAIQKKVGKKQDGLAGPDTFKGMQKWLGTVQDGVVSNPSSMVKAFQKWLNKQ